MGFGGPPAHAVAFGQLTPGPIVQTVAVVGYAAAGLGGALMAALIAFSPPFLVVLVGGARFEALRLSAGARAFLDGAGPAPVGAILGALVPLAGATLRHGRSRCWSRPYSCWPVGAPARWWCWWVPVRWARSPGSRARRCPDRPSAAVRPRPGRRPRAPW
ncbi:MAG TPA: chromate transporter [Solirubrobacteraceae bacterium]|nr:chromate transporter [Solirubrobacteraceae bacterium]